MTDRAPLSEADKRDRFDCAEDRWVWCEQCSSWCEARYGDCYEHRWVITYPAIESLDGDYGPLTFAPQPDQLNTPNQDRPSKALPPEIDAALTRALADAWDEGWHQGYVNRHEGRLVDGYIEIDPATNPYRQEQHQSVLFGDIPGPAIFVGIPVLIEHGITPREERR